MKILEIMDSLLATFYRFPGDPIWSYYIGTLLVALLAVVIGEFTASLVYRVNRSHREKIQRRVAELEALAQKALEMGDEESYKACNKEANEAFGRSFFGNFGLSAASLWPCPFALAWMQRHFSGFEIPLPFVGLNVGYIPTFIVSYIAARIFFGKIRHKLPYFRGVHAMLLASQGRRE
jgi:hypothetical protein